MSKQDILNHLSPDEQSRMVLARVLDKADHARTRNVPANSQFLTDGEQGLAEKALAAAGAERYRLWGGYEEAERRVCLFLPDWLEDIEPGGEEDPLAAVEVTAPQEAKLTHRDYLGSMMGLGLSRDALGDILIRETGCQAVCLKTVLPALLAQWTEVGRYPVRVRELPLAELTPGERDVRLRRETFQSLRFDAVAAAGFNISRAKAASLISGGHIQLNHLPCVKPDRILEPGDSLTAKGFGKCVLARVTGQSRKGRIMAELERYG